MFVHENLKLGDKFYKINVKSSFFHRKKIHKKIDGEDWFRYDIPLREYEIITYTVMGILRKNIEGEWKYGNEYDLNTEIYVHCDYENGNTNSHIFRFHQEIDDYANFFTDKNEAIARIKKLEKEDIELDKK